MTEFSWRQSTTRPVPVWHLMREDGKARCGRTPLGAWKRTDALRWDRGCCLSCLDIERRMLPWQETE